MNPEDIRRRVRVRLQEQRDLIEELLQRRQQLAGSLFVRYGVCGKAGCACHSGHRHGPYYVLSTRSGGRGGYAYLDAARMAEARGLVKSFREFRRGMRRLRRLSDEIVVLLRRYQEETARQGCRRVGIPPQAHA